MIHKRLTLAELKIQSFITSVNHGNLIIGGNPSVNEGSLDGGANGCSKDATDEADCTANNCDSINCADTSKVPCPPDFTNGGPDCITVTPCNSDPL